MKLQSLIEMLFILLSRDKVSASYLANRLNVSLRTVYRYIDELSIIVPIYNTRGRNGGFQVSDTYKLPSSFLTKDESSFLTSVLTSMNSELNSKMLTNIIDKITAISKQPQIDGSLDFGNVIIDGGPWGNVEDYKQTITFFEKCIEEKTVVLIGYRGRDEILSEREIEPHTLVLKEGFWYIYAYCLKRNEFRLFKMARIEKANALNKSFERRAVDNLKETLKNWYLGISTVLIDFEIDKSIKGDVEEWLGVDKVFESESGIITASANLPISAELVGKILSFGNKIKVLSPNSLVKQVKKTVLEVAQNY